MMGRGVYMRRKPGVVGEGAIIFATAESIGVLLEDCFGDIILPVSCSQVGLATRKNEIPRILAFNG